MLVSRTGWRPADGGRAVTADLGEPESSRLTQEGGRFWDDVNIDVGAHCQFSGVDAVVVELVADAGGGIVERR